MTPFLSSRDQHRRVQRSFSSFAKSSKTLPGERSVHFEDERAASKSKTQRVSSAGAVVLREERKTHFPWKKHKKPRHSDSLPEEVDGRSSDGEKSSLGASPNNVSKAHSARGAPSRSGPSASAASTPLNLLGNVDLPRMENRYDLYAVCNHYGSMSNGHYTAFCKNPVDGNWYNYDDECVHSVTESQLVTNGAYLLFYVRQELVTHSPLSSSTSSTSSSSSSNHWIHHIPRFTLDFGDFVEETPPPRTESETRAGVRPNSASSAPSSAVGVSPSSNEDVFSTSGGPQLQSRVSCPQPIAEAVCNVPRQRLYSNPPPFQSTPFGVEAMVSPQHSNHHLSGRHPSLKLGKIKYTSNQGDISPIAVRRAGSFHDNKHMGVRRADTVPVDYADDSYRASLVIGPVPLSNSNAPQYLPEHLGHIATQRAWHSSVTHLENNEQQFPVVGQGLSRSVYFTPSSSDHESCV